MIQRFKDFSGPVLTFEPGGKNERDMKQEDARERER